MACEAFVIGNAVTGLALMAAVLSFQVLADRKAAVRKTLKLKEEERLTADTIAV